MNEIKTILFPTDFSEYSKRAFNYATSLAEAFGSRLVLLHVAELEEEDPANPAHSFPALTAYTGVVEVERVVIRGHAPYRDILDVSRAKHCDLIVMATHGRSALSQFFLGGSVAEEVARFSTIPVFIVKVDVTEPAEHYQGQISRILFPTDLSPAAATAYPLAALFAERFAASLVALHVIDEEGAEFYERQGLQRKAADFKTQVTGRLQQYLQALPGAEATSAIEVVEGQAETEIVNFAAAHDIDLIVLATHGHRGFRAELLGTTTDRVVRRADSPVLTVRSL